MPSLNSLPLELIQEILDHIDSVKQLVQCRLVNKTFSDIVERIILKKQITIKTAFKAIQLYEYLKNKRSRCSQITHLDINVSFYDDSSPFINLLRLAFTPSMEVLGGLSNSSAIFVALCDISNSSTTKFDKVKMIPSCKRDYDNNYNNALLQFKKTLESMCLTYYNSINWKFVCRLKEFKILNSLYLELVIQNVETLENILKECTQIKELTIHLVFRIDTISKERLNTLLKASNQITTLKKLTIKGVCRPDLVEYLAHKYPNIDYILIDTVNRDPPWDTYTHRISLDFHNIDRITNLLGHIPSYELNFRLKRGFTLKTIQNCILKNNDKNLISETKVRDVIYYHITVRGPEMKRIVERIHNLVVKSND